jgi:hypothetical protein
MMRERRYSQHDNETIRRRVPRYRSRGGLLHCGQQCSAATGNGVNDDPFGDHDHMHGDLDHYDQAAGSHLRPPQPGDDRDDHDDASDGTCAGTGESVVHGLKPTPRDRTPIDLHLTVT